MARELAMSAEAIPSYRNNRAGNRDILNQMSTAFRPVDRFLQCASAFAYVYFYPDHTEGRAQP